MVLIATACGAEAVPPEQSASEEGRSANIARVETVVRASGSGGEVEYRTSSVVDFARGRSTYVDSGTGCRTIVMGDLTYTEVPSGLGLPDGKRWVESSGEENFADLEAEFEKTQKPQTGANETSSSMLLFAPPEPPPAEYLAYLRRHGSLDRIGDEEEVRGVPATRYRMTLDRDQLTREQLEQVGWKDANIDAYLEQTLDAEEEIEVWVDAAGRTRRIVTTSSTDPGPFGLTHRSVTTTEYFDFGVDVEIAAPPDAEVLGPGEWQRVNEERMKAEQSAAEGTFESLPNAFAPSVQPTCER